MNNSLYLSEPPLDHSVESLQTRIKALEYEIACERARDSAKAQQQQPLEQPLEQPPMDLSPIHFYEDPDVDGNFMDLEQQPLEMEIPSQAVVQAEFDLHMARNEDLAALVGDLDTIAYLKDLVEPESAKSLEQRPLEQPLEQPLDVPPPTVQANPQELPLEQPLDVPPPTVQANLPSIPHASLPSHAMPPTVPHAMLSPEANPVSPQVLFTPLDVLPLPEPVKPLPEAAKPLEVIDLTDEDDKDEDDKDEKAQQRYPKRNRRYPREIFTYSSRSISSAKKKYKVTETASEKVSLPLHKASGTASPPSSSSSDSSGSSSLFDAWQYLGLNERK